MRTRCYAWICTGSGAKGSSHPARSDLDFRVEFQPLEPRDHALTCFDLLEDRQDLFQRRIDLVEVKAVSNPYFLEAIERDRTRLYVA